MAAIRKTLRAIIGLTACCVLAFSLYQIFIYLRDVSSSRALTDDLIKDAVELLPSPEAAREDAAAPGDTGSAQPEVEAETGESAPIKVDFEALRRKNEDIIAWLYSEDTPINLPVLQAGDNDYYLYRLADGSYNPAGSLFADYRNNADFSSPNTIIYGHNMKNGSMFGSLREYRNQDYYDEHPVIWLLTPEEDYRLELVAGFVTADDNRIYTLEQDEDSMLELAEEAIKYSAFDSGAEAVPGSRYLTLSTCTYDYDNARYVLLCRLVPLGSAHEAG